ncbi:MAG: hypothetical protein H6696_03285 [Deferribacteres bacterium]|nr:hypothetical protein [Deferribacteres bacterium]
MVRFNGQQAQYWRTLFIKMQNAHDNCGVALREDLKTELDSTAQTFAALESRHQELRAQEKDLRKQAAAEQRKSAKILNRTRYALLSLTGKEKVAPVLLAYGLDRRGSESRQSVLHQLRKVQDSLLRESTEIKPEETLVTAINASATKLAQLTESIQTAKANLEEVKKSLENAIATNRDVRERIRGYLVSVLPEGHKDAKLIDYGLREMFPAKPASRVRVISEEESGTVPESIAASGIEAEA